ncbi:FXYD domain-containing ion transport regulator 3 isoform X5 [Manis javanica]|uniref:FXYD domain-containing ion transport regulator 3 isoform X5 n=1 Tax=Manis javanica TaxID=9974 RepID=UPI003C6D2DAE
MAEGPSHSHGATDGKAVLALLLGPPGPGKSRCGGQSHLPPKLSHQLQSAPEQPQQSPDGESEGRAQAPGPQQPIRGAGSAAPLRPPISLPCAGMLRTGSQGVLAGHRAWRSPRKRRQPSNMQEVVLSLLIFLASLPALAANDPEDKNSPFYYGTQCLFAEWLGFGWGRCRRALRAPLGFS